MPGYRYTFREPPRWADVRAFAAWWRAGNSIDLMAMADWHKGKGGVNLPDYLLAEWNALSDAERAQLLAYARREDVSPPAAR